MLFRCISKQSSWPRSCTNILNFRVELFWNVSILRGLHDRIMGLYTTMAFVLPNGVDVDCQLDHF